VEQRRAAATASGHDVGGQFAAAAGGQTGALAQGAMQGGVAGAMVALLTMSKGFAEVVERMNGAIQVVADAFGFLFDVLGPMLQPLLDTITALAPILQVLTVVGIAPLIAILLPLAVVLAPLVPAFRAVGRAIEWLVNGIQSALSWLGLGEEQTAVAGSSASVAASRIARGVGTAEDYAAIQAEGLGSSKNTNNQKAYKIQEYEAATNVASALNDAARAAREFSDSMTSMPAGLKVAARRYQATEAENAIVELVLAGLRRRSFVESGSPFGGG
jgi:hypothetical protein